jgi:hypothetical protein
VKMKKASGAENRKRKSAREKEDESHANRLRQFFLSTKSASESATSRPETVTESGSEQAKDADVESPEPKNDGTDEDASCEGLVCDTQGETSGCVGLSASSDPAKWPTVLSHALRDEIVQYGPINCPTNMKRFPIDQTGRRFSKKLLDKLLPNGEIVTRRWLVYSPSVDKVFCFCCRLFDAERCRSALATCGLADWKHLTQAKLAEHESSSWHCKCQSQWIECCTRLSQAKCIDAVLQDQIRAEITHWRGVLQRLLDIILFLAGRDMGLRGSSDRLFTPNNGNFLGLVELLGKYDDVLKEHLRRAQAKEISDHYCSKIIQDELIERLAQHVQGKIVASATLAKYFALILDCTPDISRKEQMSFTVRYVDLEGAPKVVEHFLCFKQAKDSTGEGLTELILETLVELGLNVADCRGQGYDNGANMRGKHKGVQRRILDLNGRAFYVPCGCHSLNLVVGDAVACCVTSMLMFGVIQRIYTVLSASAPTSPRRHGPQAIVRNALGMSYR